MAQHAFQDEEQPFAAGIDYPGFFEHGQQVGGAGHRGVGGLNDCFQDEDGVVGVLEGFFGGCGGVYRRRIFTAYFNNKVQHAALLSGSSRAGPRLQWDIVRALLPVARASARKRGCPARSVRLLKAELDGAASDAARAPWNETWTVSDCAGSHDYAISFKPDPKGGATWAAKAK